MKPARLLITCFLASTAFAAPQVNTTHEAGKKALQTACVPCHSLCIVESQRLSTAAWQKEIDKMVGWGAIVPDKQLLLDYLSQHYSNMLPPPAPALSTSGK